MDKLLISLIAGLFSLGVMAQAKKETKTKRSSEVFKFFPARNTGIS